MPRSDARHDQLADTPPLPEQEVQALPARLRLLCFGTHEPSWVGLTLQLDASGCVEPVFKWVSTAAEMLAVLRDESFDCLVIADSSDAAAGKPLLVARAIRASGCDDPVVAVVSNVDDAAWVEAQSVRADLLVTQRGWESRALVPFIQRAIERVHVARENHRLSAADRRRLVRERDEADYLLNQQRQIIHELEQLAQFDRRTPPATPLAAAVAPAAGPQPLALPPELDTYYQELLRTYVIMGSGNLGGEIARLVELLCIAGMGPRQALELHLMRVEQLVRGLGNRSTRHVMARADLLALELMIYLGESYQKKSQEQALPPHARPAPSTESLANV